MFKASYEPILQKVADELGMKKDHLYKVIMMESSWNFDAYNPSGAIGLIQFMPQTLKGMRLLSPSLSSQIPANGAVPEIVKQLVKKEFLAKYPDAPSQLLGPVKAYFNMYKPFDTEQSVYMAVFYPAYRKSELTTTFSDTIRAQNPGIDTVGDYVNRVNKIALKKQVVQKGGPLLGLAALAIVGYAMLK